MLCFSIQTMLEHLDSTLEITKMVRYFIPALHSTLHAMEIARRELPQILSELTILVERLRFLWDLEAFLLLIHNFSG